VTEPEIALVFTADPWVEQLHRHLSDHGGARVRSLVVEASVALEESYDVLVVSHRWPLLTRAFVADVRARGRRVLGVHDLAEPASRTLLADVEVDAVIASDAAVDAFVRALTTLAAKATAPSGIAVPAERTGRLVAVGGPPGVGRTEVAIQLAVVLMDRATVALVDADDVAPSIAQRLALPLEPNLRTAIDAVEHGRGELAAALQTESRTGLPVLAGTPNPDAWAQVRPSEVLRVLDRVADSVDLVVVDGVGSLQDVGSPPRGRFATAQVIVREADVLVAVCDASPTGISRLLSWTVDARNFAPETPVVAVVNRAPPAAFRRGELFDEIASSIDVVDVVFVVPDARVTDAAWAGTLVGRGRFTRALERVATRVCSLPRRSPPVRLDVAS
jgi:MinD-like ATPase involved in chromosome partitioning or flagellar assembly